MKNKVSRAISFLLLSVICVSLLSGCGSIKSSEAKATAEGFFTEIKKPDYDAAAAYFHPDANVNGDNLKELFEKQLKMDPSKLESTRYDGFQTSSQIGGATFDFNITMTVDSVDYTVSMRIAENGNGYGIWYFNVSLYNSASSGNNDKTNL